MLCRTWQPAFRCFPCLLTVCRWPHPRTLRPPAVESRWHAHMADGLPAFPCPLTVCRWPHPRTPRPPAAESRCTPSSCAASGATWLTGKVVRVEGGWEVVGGVGRQGRRSGNHWGRHAARRARKVQAGRDLSPVHRCTAVLMYCCAPLYCCRYSAEAKRLAKRGIPLLSPRNRWAGCSGLPVLPPPGRAVLNNLGSHALVHSRCVLASVSIAVGWRKAGQPGSTSSGPCCAACAQRALTLLPTSCLPAGWCGGWHAPPP